MLIFLVGPRASGKTTVGRALAGELALPFEDTDHYLVQRQGRSVADIVAESGWPAFRELESQCLRELIASHGGGAVLSTGGGMVLAEGNRIMMREAGLVFYLKGSAELLVGRLRQAPDAAQRPSLTGRGLLEEVAQVLDERGPLYEGVAHHILDAAASPQALCAEVKRCLANGGSKIFFDTGACKG